MNSVEKPANNELEKSEMLISRNVKHYYLPVSPVLGELCMKGAVQFYLEC